jgi:hypothetical protein
MKYDSFVELVDSADLAFAARAVGDDENRPQLWYMKIAEKDGGLTATATDGSRLHRARLKEREAKAVSPGFWRVLKNKAVRERDYDAENNFPLGYRVYEKKHVLWLARLEEFGLFPPDDVIDGKFPEGEPVRQGTVNTGKYQRGDMNRFIKGLPDGAGINPEYLKDLGPFEWNYAVFSPRKPVLFESGNKTALIVPLTLEPGPDRGGGAPGEK